MAAFLLALASRTSVAAAPSSLPGLSFIPLDHWSYQVFYRLSTIGLVPLHQLSARPITRFEARRLTQLAVLSLREASPAIAGLAQEDVRRLREEFSSEPVLELVLGSRASSVAFSYAPVPSVLVHGRASGSLLPDAPQRNEVYASFQFGSVLALTGRTSSSWGPSLRTGLLLSDNAGTFPILRLTAEIPRARFTKTVAFLERPGGSPLGEIALFATRLDWMATPSFRLGLSEAVVTGWGGPLTFYHLLQPLPVLSAVMASYDLHDALGQARNMSVSIDFDWLPGSGIRLYGAGFVDDALDRISERRAKIGILGGLYLTDPFKTGRTSLRLEYSAVTNGTYGYPIGLEHAYQGRSLGHWLGPDGDDLYFELTQRLNSIASLQLFFAYTRHGQGRIGQSSPPPEDWFLSGVVERRRTLGFQLHTIHSGSLEMRYLGEIAHVANRGNQAGVEAWEGSLGLEFTYRWPSTSSVDAFSNEKAQVQPIPSPSGPPSRFSLGRVSVRNWGPAITSAGPLAGQPSRAMFQGVHYRGSIGTLALSLNYDAAPGQTFWSGDLHYPLAQFQNGAVWILGGWGGLRYEGELGGANRQLMPSGPRLGAAVLYEVSPGGKPSPLHLKAEISSPFLRGWFAPREGGAPFYLWTYSAGIEWQSTRRWTVEVGYRGAAAIWRVGTAEQTNIQWGGLYFGVSYR